MGAGPQWGPLDRLAGSWEGDQGLDVAYSNERGVVAETPYRERTELKPFGPVENGSQVLYGLDYRMAAWRGDEENPFHTEVGYWLWDAASRQVMRSFCIPRGSVVLAGGTADAGDARITMSAELGSENYGILSNIFLCGAAQTVRYEISLEIHDDGSFSYDETSTIRHAKLDELLQHTDRNRLRPAG
jgi:hypothetical protein